MHDSLAMDKRHHRETVLDRIEKRIGEMIATGTPSTLAADQYGMMLKKSMGNLFGKFGNLTVDEVQSLARHFGTFAEHTGAGHYKIMSEASSWVHAAMLEELANEPPPPVVQDAPAKAPTPKAKPAPRIEAPASTPTGDLRRYSQQTIIEAILKRVGNGVKDPERREQFRHYILSHMQTTCGLKDNYTLLELMPLHTELKRLSGDMTYEPMARSHYGLLATALYQVLMHDRSKLTSLPTQALQKPAALPPAEPSDEYKQEAPADSSPAPKIRRIDNGRVRYVSDTFVPQAKEQPTKARVFPAPMQARYASLCDHLGAEWLYAVGLPASLEDFSQLDRTELPNIVKLAQSYMLIEEDQTRADKRGTFAHALLTLHQQLATKGRSAA